MIRPPHRVVVGCLALASACAAQVGVESPREPRAGPWPGIGAVGRITARNAAGEEVGSGTGFWISRTELVTNWHVLLHAPQPVLIMADGATYRITHVAGADERADVAVLRAEPEFNRLPLILEPEPPAPGTEVRVIGGPGINPTRVLDGAVIAQREIGFYGQTVLLAMRQGIAMGWSGSPIVDRQGRCLGVARMGGAAKGFGAPTAVIRSLRSGALTPISDWKHAPATNHGRSQELLWQTHGEGRLSDDRKFPLLRQAVEASPDFWPAWGELATIHELRGESDAALEAYRIGAAYSPMAGPGQALAHALRRRGLNGEADAAEARAAELDPHGVAWREFTLRAVQTMREGRFEEALDPLGLAVNAEPETLEFRLNYAQCLAQTGRAAEALPQVQIVLGRDPASHLAYYTRGVALLRLDRFLEAAGSFARAVELSPRTAVYRRMLGQTYAALGRFDEAEAELKAVRELDPPQARELEALISHARASRSR